MLEEMKRAHWDKRYTNKSIAVATRYYKYFNNGVIPRGKEFQPYVSMQFIERKLEKTSRQDGLNRVKRFRKHLSNKLTGDTVTEVK